MAYFIFELWHFGVEKAYFISELWDAEGAEDADGRRLFISTDRKNKSASVCVLCALCVPFYFELFHRMQVAAVDVGEGGADGSAVFRIFGDVKTDVVHLFQFRENLFALRQLCEVAYQDEIANRTVERRENRALTDGLHHHVDDSGGNIFRERIAVSLSEGGSRRVEG